MFEKLTLVVFLKDRAEFTKRFCVYLSEVKYPFLVYFADGSLSDENEKYLSNLKNVNFSFLYKRYPKDVSLLDYYKKCRLSFSDIKTPYAMIADNDDFPVWEGQLKAVEFLENNPSFIGCNGRVMGIFLSPCTNMPYGKNCLFHPHYCQTMDIPVQLDQEAATQRIESYLKNFYSVYYSVFRTESLVHTSALIEEFNFSELGIHELFFSYSQIAQGKINSIGDVTYIRQKGSSQAAATQKDWFHRLFHTNWLEDSKKTLVSIARSVAEKENHDFERCKDILYRQFVDRMRSRYVPNNFYIFYGFNLDQLKKRLFFGLLSRVFSKFPSLGELISSKIFLKTNMKQIKDSIKKSISP